MDVCVVTYRNTVQRIVPALRPHDVLWVRDNTIDNVGFPAACNELAAHGTDDIILFVNPDLDPAVGCFDALERSLDDPTRIAVGGSDRPGAGADQDAEWLSGACLAVRRSAFDAVGGFDASLFLYAEDLDLSYRLARLGRLSYIATAVYHHDSTRRSLRSEFLQARNFIVVQRRHGRSNPLVPTIKAALGSAARGDWRLAVARVAGAAASFTRRSRLPAMCRGPCSSTRT